MDKYARFPSPSGDPLFKSVKNGGMNMRMQSFRPLPGILYSNCLVISMTVNASFPSPSGDPLFKFCFDPSKVLTGGGFRPLPGILYSNERRCSLCYLELVSVPFRGSFIQIGFKKLWWICKGFPSPSGDPLFKCEEGRAMKYIVSFRPLPGILYSNSLWSSIR